VAWVIISKLSAFFAIVICETHIFENQYVWNWLDKRCFYW
jgi:hypothetical protein